MIYTPLVNKALRIAYEAHQGQVGKAGVPYVFHPFHLAEQMEGEYETVVALLHDVAEDTDVTLEQLAEQFPHPGKCHCPGGKAGGYAAQHGQQPDGNAGGAGAKPAAQPAEIPGGVGVFEWGIKTGRVCHLGKTWVSVPPNWPLFKSSWRKLCRSLGKPKEPKRAPFLFLEW